MASADASERDRPHPPSRLEPAAADRRGEFVARHQRGLWRFARLLGAASDHADDLVQEALLAALHKRIDARPAPEAAAWLRADDDGELPANPAVEFRDPQPVPFLVIQGVRNLRLCTIGGPVRVLGRSPADVLRCEGCSDVTIEGLVLGHDTEVGSWVTKPSASCAARSTATARVASPTASCCWCAKAPTNATTVRTSCYPARNRASRAPRWSAHVGVAARTPR